MDNKDNIDILNQNLQLLIQNINNLVSEIQNLQNIILNFPKIQTKIEEERRIFLDEILKFPEKYHFKFMDNMSIGELLLKKLPEINKEELKKKLQISDKDVNSLFDDKFTLNMHQCKELAHLLEVSLSDILCCKVQTVKKAQLKVVPISEFIKPYVHLETIQLIKHLAQREFVDIVGFFTNLFVINKSNNLYSLNENDYENKSNEEIKLIEEVRHNALVLEYPSNFLNGNINPKDNLKFVFKPLDIIEYAAVYTNNIFIRIIKDKEPEFLRLKTENYQGAEEIQERIELEDLINKEIFVFSPDDFLAKWQKCEFEVVIVFDSNSNNFFSDLIEDKLTGSELYDLQIIFQNLSSVCMNDEIFYKYIKNKWIETDQENPTKKKLVAIINPSEYNNFKEFKKQIILKYGLNLLPH
jgi:hypothetical protein